MWSPTTTTTGISILTTYSQCTIRTYQSQSLLQHAVVLCLGAILVRLPLRRHVVSVLALLSTTPRLVVPVAHTPLCLELHHLADLLPALLLALLAVVLVHLVATYAHHPPIHTVTIASVHMYLAFLVVDHLPLLVVGPLLLVGLLLLVSLLPVGLPFLKQLLPLWNFLLQEATAASHNGA